MSLVPRLKPFIGLREVAAALTPSSGKLVQYEKAFAAKFGCENGVMFSHGRSALYALLKSWNLSNDEIVCPAYTCVVVQHAVVLSGNVPVFVDCRKDQPNMDLRLLESAITEKTRAVIATHLFGYPMNVVELQKIVERAEKQYGHKIYVIQDVAHSYGAEWEGKLVTTYGDAAFFGSNISKIMTSIFGGMLITNSKQTFEAVHSFRADNFKKSGFSKALNRFVYLIAIVIAFNEVIYGFTNWLERTGFLNRFVRYYDESEIDFPSDWDQFPIEMEARVGLVQLSKYDRIIEIRRSISRVYFKALKDLNDVQLFESEDGCTFSHFVAVVEDREKWCESFRALGIQLGILVEYSVPYMKAYEKYRRGDYPNSLHFSKHTINLPNWPGVNTSKVINGIKTKLR